MKMATETGIEMRQDLRRPQDLRDAKTLIAGFIDAQVVRRGLDWRTGEAYRIDLEHFYKWLDGEGAKEEDRVIGVQSEGRAESSRKESVRENDRAAGLQGSGQATGARGRELGTGAEQERPQKQSCIPSQDGRRWQEKMEAYLEYLAMEKRLRPSTVARKSRVFNYYLSYLVRQGLLQDCGPLKLRRAAGGPQRRGWDGGGLAGVDSAENAGGPVDVDRIGNADGPMGAGGARSADGLADAGGAESAGRRMDIDVTRYAGCTGYARAGHIKEDIGGDRMTKTDVDAFFLALEREYDALDSDFRKRVCLRDLVMMELLFYHGIEVTELLRLEVSDYDQKTGVLTVKKKRGRADVIYLYSRALRERMERWILEHGEFERETEYKERMFLSKLGRPLSMKMVINIFEKYRVLAGIEKEVTPKDLKRCMGEYARELMREWCG